MDAKIVGEPPQRFDVEELLPVEGAKPFPSVPEVPLPLLQHILSFLPKADQTKAAKVCKCWRIAVRTMLQPRDHLIVHARAAFSMLAPGKRSKHVHDFLDAALKQPGLHYAARLETVWEPVGGQAVLAHSPPADVPISLLASQSPRPYQRALATSQDEGIPARQWFDMISQRWTEVLAPQLQGIESDLLLPSGWEFSDASFEALLQVISGREIALNLRIGAKLSAFQIDCLKNYLSEGRIKLSELFLDVGAEVNLELLKPLLSAALSQETCHSLRIWACAVDDNLLAAISLCNGHLKRLHFDQPLALSPAGYTELSGLIQEYGLDYLFLRGLDNDACIAITEGIKAGEVKELILRDGTIDIHGITSLQGCGSLCRLVLDHNNIGAMELEKLGRMTESMPTLEFLSAAGKQPFTQQEILGVFWECVRNHDKLKQIRLSVEAHLLKGMHKIHPAVHSVGWEQH